MDLNAVTDKCHCDFTGNRFVALAIPHLLIFVPYVLKRVIAPGKSMRPTDACGATLLAAPGPARPWPRWRGVWRGGEGREGARRGGVGRGGVGWGEVR